MMGSLPTEILSSITTFLPLQDKLNCILVCTQWHQVITQSTLYETLVFFKENNTTKTTKKFHQALNFFNNKPYIGQHVRQLEIQQLDDKINAEETVITLTRLFPNITSLKWIERKSREYKHFNQCLPPSEAYKQVLKKWKHLAHIVDYQTHFSLHITNNLLLDQWTCAHLKSLQVTLDNYTYGNYSQHLYCRDMLKELIENLHHAPSIQQLHITKTAIKLMDVEHICLTLPNLKELVLKEVYVYSQDHMVNITAHNATAFDSLESFSLIAYTQNALEINSLEFEQTLIHWISYIGEKCRKNLQHLDFYCHHYDYNSNERIKGTHFFEDAVVNALSKLKKLSSYDIISIPLTQRIVKMMEASKIQLNKLRLDMTSQYMMNQQLLTLTSSTNTKSIKTLEIHFSMHYSGYPLLTNNLTKVCNSLKNLTCLKIKGTGDLPLFFDILHQLPQLTTLDFSTLYFATNEAEQKAYEGLISQLPTVSNIKSLSINMYASSTDYCWSQISRVYSFIFNSCSQLQHFKLTGIIYAASMEEPLDLDFRGNNSLKSITLDLLGTSYYTFNHVASKRRSKRWVNYYREILETEYREYKKHYHVNLAWPKERNCYIDLQLTDCLTCLAG